MLDDEQRCPIGYDYCLECGGCDLEVKGRQKINSGDSSESSR